MLLTADKNIWVKVLRAGWPVFQPYLRTPEHVKDRWRILTRLRSVDHLADVYDEDGEVISDTEASASNTSPQPREEASEADLRRKRARLATDVASAMASAHKGLSDGFSSLESAEHDEEDEEEREYAPEGAGEEHEDSDEEDYEDDPEGGSEGAESKDDAGGSYNLKEDEEEDSGESNGDEDDDEEEDSAGEDDTKGESNTSNSETPQVALAHATSASKRRRTQAGSRQLVDRNETVQVAGHRDGHGTSTVIKRPRLKY